MKVPPKRKGNRVRMVTGLSWRGASMKVPPKRKGNLREESDRNLEENQGLNESPSEKEGKCVTSDAPVAH